ncbi:hypothetical protein [Aestuariirhabdus sp. LZHN29]|uniref:F0F1 ATP synthase subunit B family protein n=1 Tax=Aestuariirhabdus sp. LZHN29 TaxID=3417462 RepID=UPI003CEA909F
MTFSWSTFALELLNFLVLVWLLQHFLYRPVQRVVRERQQKIDQTLSDADALQQRAESLRQEYEGRIEQWQHEQQLQREALQLELEERRREALEVLHKEMASLEKKREALDKRKREQQRQQDLELALGNGRHFASRLLDLCPRPELEERLLDLLLTDLESATQGLKSMLQGDTATAVVLETAFPPQEATRQALQQAVRSLLERSFDWQERINPDLRAGGRLLIGGWVLGANLQDELIAFSEVSPDKELQHED